MRSARFGYLETPLPIIHEHNRLLDRTRAALEAPAPPAAPEPPEPPGRPHWKALEDVTGIECAAFMFMGESKNGQHWMFKNIDTRRYIFLPIPREW
jgi:hypothetical protein